MIKLYRFNDAGRLYWEAWDNDDGTFTIHWGELGTEGETRTLEASFAKSAEELAEDEAQLQVTAGFDEPETVYALVMTYDVAGKPTLDELSRRQRLQEQLNETLGWTGLGHCIGGTMATDVMEVHCLVVDFDLARRVILEDLDGTEFADFSDIAEND